MTHTGGTKYQILHYGEGKIFYTHKNFWKINQNKITKRRNK